MDEQDIRKDCFLANVNIQAKPRSVLSSNQAELKQKRCRAVKETQSTPARTTEE